MLHVQVTEEFTGVGAEVGDGVFYADGEVGTTRDLEPLAFPVGCPFPLTGGLLHVPGSADKVHPFFDGSFELPFTGLHHPDREVSLLVLEFKASYLSLEVLVLADHDMLPFAVAVFGSLVRPAANHTIEVTLPIPSPGRTLCIPNSGRSVQKSRLIVANMGPWHLN